MNNSIIKLEDFELDEISGGFNKAKQVAKKAGAYAIKGTVSAVLGFGVFILSVLSADKLKYGQKIVNSVGRELAIGICSGMPSAFAGVAGWKIGGWICKKLGLED